MSKNNVSHQKVIILIVFIIAALVTSLFLFHLRNEQKPLLSNDNVTLFNVARHLKDFDLQDGSGKPFTQRELRDHWTLLFFGFTHCNSVCPTTLDMLARAYKELKPLYPNLQVVLVSVDPERDNMQSLAAYTKQYHDDFIGITGKQQALRKLQSQLGIYAEKETRADDKSYQVQHSSSILLLNPHGQWTGSIRYGLTPAEFITTFKESMTAFT